MVGMNACIRPAVDSDYQAVQAFYDQLTEDLEKEPYHPCWTRGVYPGESYLRGSIAAGELYVAEVCGQIAAAMVVNESANEGYLSADWNTQAAPGEFSVIHTLGVGTSYRKQGIGRRMIHHAIQHALRAGHKAVRLDLIDHNLPAAPVYTKAGFVPCGSLRLFYDAVGWRTFYLFEYVL